MLAFFLDFFELAFIVIPLLGPAAEHLGIDLIWFGVILGVNMQTSFMHPPFGFALFYLRSVAPREPYIDRVTGKRMEPITTGQIYWGADAVRVHPGDHGAAGDLLPAMVMHYKGVGTEIDLNKVQDRSPADRTAAAARFQIAAGTSSSGSRTKQIAPEPQAPRLSSSIRRSARCRGGS